MSRIVAVNLDLPLVLSIDIREGFARIGDVDSENPLECGFDEFSY